MYHIVYLTTNLINNKIYVGVHSPTNLDDGYFGSGKVLKWAIRKYGKENFKRQILHYCLDVEHAYTIETQIVDDWFINRKDTYNCFLGGKGNRCNKHTDISKAIIKEKRKLQVMKPMSDEHKKRLSILFTGREVSDEQRKKQSETIKEKYKNGYKQSEESILKCKETKKRNGYVVSEETRNKMSENGAGKYERTQEHRDKVSKFHKNKQLSTETKDKMSLASKGKSKSETHKNNLANANRDEIKRKEHSDRLKGRIAINNGVNNKYIDPMLLTEYIVNGWILGVKKNVSI
jgi:hypothetical protein